MTRALPRRHRLALILAVLAPLALSACGGGSDETLDPPIGKHVVFTARESGRDELYLADTGRPGTVLAKLSTALSKQERFGRFSIGTGGLMAYTAYEGVDDAESLLFLDPRRPGSTQRWRLGGLSSSTDAADVAWAADGAWAALKVYDSVWYQPFLALVVPGDTKTVHLERSLVVAEVIGLPIGRGFAVRTATALYLIDTGSGTPGAPQLRDTAPAGYGFGNWLRTTPGGSHLVVTGYAADNTGIVRAVRVDGGSPAQTLTPTQPTGTWASVVGVTDTAVFYAAGPAVGGQYRLYRVDLASPGVAIEMTPASYDGGLGWVELSPDGTQLAYSTTAGANTSAGVYTVDLAAPGLATQRAGLAAGASRPYVDGFQYVQHGAGLLVGRDSGALLNVGGYLMSEHELIRVGAHANEGVLQIAGIFPSGANPGAQVCDDGLTLLIGESMQFPPGVGGVPEAYSWLSEIHVARADSLGTTRLTKGYEPWRGVGSRACLPTNFGPSGPN